MPPAPLSCDRNHLFRDRISSSRWRDSSSYYVGSRNFNNDNDFSPRWGFPSSHFHCAPGHVKQGGWHMNYEDHEHSTHSFGDRFMDDDVFRPYGMHGDGRYVKFYRDNRPFYSHKNRRDHSWEANHHHHRSPSNGGGRPRIVNDKRLISDSFMRISHMRSDPCDQFQKREQTDKPSDANGSSMGHKVDKKNLMGSYEWKPLKKSRSRSLTSRGSFFSHTSSSKGIKGESCDLPPKNATPVRSTSGDDVPCVATVAPSEEPSSKKPRLGWGQGLAKYEKKKVEGPEENVNKDGNAVLVTNVEHLHSFTSNLVAKSPKVKDFSNCSSPATPSSFTCSSLPGLEDNSYGKAIDFDGNTTKFSVSSTSVPGSQLDGSNFSLDTMELNSITNLGSMLTELLQEDYKSSMDTSFTRSSALNRLLLWKDDIAKALKLTETEIESLENELASLQANTSKSLQLPALSDSGLSDGVNVLHVPQLLVSNGDIILENRLPCDEAKGVKVDVRDEDIDSPGTATSKFVDPPVQKFVSLELHKTSVETSTKSTMENLVACEDESDVGTSCQSCDKKVILDSDAISGIVQPNVCEKEEGNLCDIVLASNKETADRAAEFVLKLLPSCDYSLKPNGVYCLPAADTTVKKKFLNRKRFLRFKERVISSKYRILHNLWKEDLHLRSLKSYHGKPHKKLDLSSRSRQIRSHKHRSSTRSPAGSLSLVPTPGIIDFTGKLISDSKVKVYRNSLKMPAMILDEKEKMSRILLSNGLVEDPCAVEKERSLVNSWTAEDKRIFIDKLAIHGKDFRKIASFFDQKTTADCVEFYYKNHKLECFKKIKKLKGKNLGKPLSSSTYLVTSEKKWSREMNASSLDILGAASVIAAQAEQALETPKSLLRKPSHRKSNGLDGIKDASNQDWKQQKTGIKIKWRWTPEVTQNVDDSCSDEGCGEWDPADWTDNEKSLFVQAFSSHGKDFSLISQCVKTKSIDQCKVFFSKVRKCLGLDTILFASGIGEIHSNNGTNRTGTNNEDAGIAETDSVFCTDKSGCRIDEDLLRVNSDVSMPEAYPELEENCGLGQLDHKYGCLEDDDLLPNADFPDVSDPVDTSGMIDNLDKDAAVNNQSSDIHANSKMDAAIGKSASGISDRTADVGVFSTPGRLANPRNGSSKPSTSGDHAQHAQFGQPRCNSGFPFDLTKADLHDVITHTVASESIVGHLIQDSVLKKCSHIAAHNSISKPPLRRNKSDVVSSCSSKTKLSCSNGDTKLFGFTDDRISFHGLENVPISNYGIWDGTKIQTDFSTLPDSAFAHGQVSNCFCQPPNFPAEIKTAVSASNSHEKW
ncbi:unnamed protein product [Amaranthus hypochondriacus]